MISIIDHIILFSLLFAYYAFWGKYNVNRNGASFWMAAVVPILLYVIIVGSRYGWGVDYLWYRVQYEYDVIEQEKAFKWLNQFLKFIGFNYVGAFMVYSFILIIGAFLLLRTFGAQSMYMYCFLIPATLYFPTAIIRQGIGVGFIFLALAFFQRRKWIYMAIASFLAFYTHSTTIVTIIGIVGIFFMFKKPIHYMITIPLYLFFAFVFDVGKMAFVADLISKIPAGTYFDGYVDNSEMWFGEDAVSAIYTLGNKELIVRSLFYVAIFYLGYIALKAKENKHVLYIYHTFVIGSIALRAVNNFEILRRFAQPMELFYFIPLGYVFYVYFKDCKQPENRSALLLKKYFPAGITLIMLYLVFFWGRFIFLNPAADFFWHNLEEVVSPNVFM